MADDLTQAVANAAELPNDEPNTAEAAAEAAGLPRDFGVRLRGETPESLAADAAELAKQLGVKPPGEEAPITLEELAKTDPAKFNELVDSGAIRRLEPPTPRLRPPPSPGPT